MCFLFAFPISFSVYRVLFCLIPSMSNIKLPSASRSAPQNKSCPQPGSPGAHFLSAPSSLAPCNLALTLSRELVPNQLISGKRCLTTSSPAYPAGPLLFFTFLLLRFMLPWWLQTIRLSFKPCCYLQTQTQRWLPLELNQEPSKRPSTFPASSPKETSTAALA